MSAASFVAVVVFLFSFLSVPSVVHGQDNNGEELDYSCDVTSDPCPYQFDGTCDNEFGFDLASCEGGDCFDCDIFCPQYDRNCQGCLDQKGCYWCASEGLCRNSNLYTANQLKIPDTSGCGGNPGAWTQDTCTLSGTEFSDPLYLAQEWIFDAINIKPVWERGYFGKGVRIRITDDGVDVSHAEFEGRIDLSASCDSYLPNNNDFHGTAVASVVGGGGNNDLCGVGIAPQVNMSVCNSLSNIALALWTKIDQVDISQNSYGRDACQLESRRKLESCPFDYQHTSSPCSICGDFSSINRDCESSIEAHCTSFYEEDIKGCVEFLDLFVKDGRCEYNVLSEDEQNAITTGILEGREGKGIIYVWASGNTFKAGDDTNFQGYLNSRFTIAVGSTDRDGLHADYSNSGAALFVTAPGGSNSGYSYNFAAAAPGGGCSQKNLAGTSFSCPVVSAVLALLLEARPDLTWRDVQGILATTSKMVFSRDDETRTKNGAGIVHSDYYGFGVIDAGAALEAALTWPLYTPEEMLLGESRFLNSPIVDDPSKTLFSSINLQPEADNFIAESVVVYASLQHFSRGDLEISLFSPGGSVSVLSPGNRPENVQLDEDEVWKLLTVKHWGEFAAGDWTIAISDKSPGDVDGCADKPFEAFLSGSNTKVECNLMESNFYCFDGGPQEGSPDGIFTVKNDDGITSVDACCACGGGVSTDDYEDRIIRWRIVVYGRSYTAMPTISPSPTATLRPTVRPTPIPDNPSSAARGHEFLWILLFFVFGLYSVS